MIKSSLIALVLVLGCKNQGDVSPAVASVPHAMTCTLVASPTGGSVDRCENDEAICYIGDSVESYAVSCHWKGEGG